MTSLLPPTLEDPRVVLATHGRSFHHAARLLGPEHATRAARLYAWCREVDDVADRATTSVARAAARDRLLELRSSLATGSVKDPLAAPLLRLAGEVDADPRPALDLIDGVLTDLGVVRVRDEAELVRYGYAVAGTVGLLMLPVLDVHEPAARPFAVDLGIAMQLTNIARDIVEDARIGRRYLPGAWFGDLQPHEIIAPDDLQRAAIEDGVARLLELAERYYASGEAGLVHLPPRPRAAIRVAARVYRRIGRRLERHDHDVWAGRTVVPSTVKGAVTIGALSRQVIAGRATPQHDPSLHEHLAGASW